MDLLLIVLYFVADYFFPYSDSIGGGTRLLKARLYTLVKYTELEQSLVLEDGTELRWPGYRGWKIYWYPNQEDYRRESTLNMEYFPYEEYVTWLKEHGKEIPYTNYEEFKEWERMKRQKEEEYYKNLYHQKSSD